MENHNEPHNVEEEVWTSPADHFRPRAKMLTLYTDVNFVLARYFKLKEFFLNRSWVPFWTPFFFFGTHIEQRSRNLFLTENHLNYRPYKYRPNTESSNY